ncbi:MAG: hypothetical protein K9J06_09890 [Flavobacteriales bacterium]|nr:hypothetical protein [Flavobacteriales bacterium]
MKKTDVLSYYYSDLTSLRLLIAAIPCVGSPLDLLLSSRGNEFVYKRLEALIEELKQEMEAVEKHLIKHDFIDREECYDLTQQVFVAAARTRHREKLKLFAQVLRGALTEKASSHDPELYVKIIDELSVKELQVALLLYRVKSERESDKPRAEDYRREGMSNDAFWFSNNHPEYAREELEYMFLRLERTGLLKEVVAGAMDYAGGSYNPTKLFDQFISYIERNQ